MGFRENLKSELTYSGMLVKELATLSGVKKRTIDNYLNTHNCMPSADAAVRIANVLGVTVEYLVTGQDRQEQNHSTSFADPRRIYKAYETLNIRDQKIVSNMIKFLKEMEGIERK